MIRFATRTRVNRGLVRVIFAAYLALQVCAGFAVPAASASQFSAVPASTECCGGAATAGCEKPNRTTAATDSCSQQCLQPAHVAVGDPLSAAQIIAMHARLAMGDKVAFPPHACRLSAAPSAFHRTPLIYHLQRLLN